MVDLEAVEKELRDHWQLDPLGYDALQVCHELRAAREWGIRMVMEQGCSKAQAEAAYECMVEKAKRKGGGAEG